MNLKSEKGLEFLPFMESHTSPLQLISFDEQQNLRIDPQAVQVLQKMSQQCKSFAVISVVGNYRTGKSYLLNRVIMNRSDGFAVGSTINACTKGLCIWPELMRIKNTMNNEISYALVIDSEGIGSVGEDLNHDIKIFLLALMLSSNFIYNSLGGIDEKAIQNLNLIVKLGRHLNQASEKEFDDIVQCFPSMLWILRDFSLKLEDDSGSKITSKEYLELALKQQKGISEAIETKNRIRRQLTTFFKERDCFCLIRPCEEEKDLQNLQNLPFNKLRPEFVEQVKQLRQRIFTKLKCKYFKGVPITPCMFLDMCNFFCDAINKGQLPQVENSWVLICKAECCRLVNDSIDSYTRSMNLYCSSDKRITIQDLIDQHQKMKQQVLQQFDKMALGDHKEEYKKEIKQEIAKKYENIKVAFESTLQSQIADIGKMQLEQLSTAIAQNKITNIFEIIDILEKDRLHFEDVYCQSSELKQQFYQNIYLNQNELFQQFFSSNCMQSQQEIRALNQQLELASSEIERMQLEHQDQIQELLKEMEIKEELAKKAQTQTKTVHEQVFMLEKTILSLQEDLMKKEIQYQIKTKQMEEQHTQQRVKQQQEANQLKRCLEDLQSKMSKNMALEQQKNQYLQQEVDRFRQEKDQLSDELKKANREISSLNMVLQQKCVRYPGQQMWAGCQQQNQSSQILQTDEKTLVMKGMKGKNMDEMDLQSSLSLSFRNESENFLREWKMDKEYLEKELKLAYSQIKQHKNYHDQMMASLKQSQTTKHVRRHTINFQQETENSPQPLQDNSFQIPEQQNYQEQQNIEKIEKLEQLVNKLKKIYKLIKYASHLQCKYCKNSYQVGQFMIHLKTCQQKQSNNVVKFTVKVIKDEENFSQKLFLIDLSCNKKTWSVTKKFDSFGNLVKQLDPLLQGRERPSCFSRFLNQLFEQNSKTSSDHSIQQMDYDQQKQLIIELIKELNKLTVTHSSDEYKKFFSFDLHLSQEQLGNKKETNESLLRESLFIKLSDFNESKMDSHQYNTVQIEHNSMQIEKQDCLRKSLQTITNFNFPKQNKPSLDYNFNYDN